MLNVKSDFLLIKIMVRSCRADTAFSLLQHETRHKHTSNIKLSIINFLQKELDSNLNDDGNLSLFQYLESLQASL